MQVKLEALESRVHFAATPAGVYEFGLQSSTHSVKTVVEDADGTVVTFALLGTGFGELTISDAGWDVNIYGSTPATSVLIGAAGGDGRVAIRDINGGLRSIGRLIGPNVDVSRYLVFEGLRVATLGDLGPGGVIAISAERRATAISLRNVTDASISCTSPLRWLSVEDWKDVDGVPDFIDSSLIGTIKVRHDLAAGVNTPFLGTASIGGTWSGDSTINNAGLIAVGKLRGALNITGRARSITLQDDYVAAVDVASATGGSVHVGGAARIRSAGESFGFANHTLFTCTADVYTAAELIGANDAGSTRTFEQIINTNGKVRRPTLTSTTSPGEPVGGLARWIVTETTDLGGKTTTTTWGLNASGGISIFGAQSVDNEGEAEFVFDGEGLQVAPAVLRLYERSQSSAVGTDVTLDGATSSMHLSATGTARTSFTFLGHETVNNWLGQFLAIKVVTTLEVNVSGTVSDGVNTVPISIVSKDYSTSWIAPGVGSVLELKRHTSRTFAQGRLIEFTWETEQKKLLLYSPATAMLLQ